MDLADRTLHPSLESETVNPPTETPSPKIIARNIRFAFQPIIQLETGATHGVEALLRNYTHLGFGTIQEIFDTATFSDTLVELEIRLFERALGDFLDADLPETYRLFFNLDPRTIGDFDAFYKKIRPVLRRFAIDSKRLCLEISERVDWDPATDTARKLQDIRNQGIRIALDDFGTGFSRLKVLHDQHADYVKFDRYFIDNVSNEPKKRIFLSNMLDMFHMLGVTTQAEGIETESDLDTCRELGFGLAQGFHIARPTLELGDLRDFHVPPKTADHWVRKERSIVGGMFGDVPPDARSIPLSHTLDQVHEAFREDPWVAVLPVLDATGRPIGIIEEADLRARANTNGAEFSDSATMTDSGLGAYVRPCPIVEAGAPAGTVLQAFAESQDHRGVLLVANSKVVGFLDPSAILRMLHQSNVAMARDQNLLTKLPGTRFINDFLDVATAGWDSDWILIQFSFGNFAAFNEAYGFQQGDRAIMLFADHLKRWFLGDSVMLGHVGGDDFLVGLKNPDVASVTTATYALRRKFAEDALGFQGFEPWRSPDSGDEPIVPSRKSPPLTCRAAMLLLKNGRPAQSRESVIAALADLNDRARAEGGFAFDRIG